MREQQLLHRFPNAGQCCWRGLGWSPQHQKQAAVKVSELQFSGVVFFVKFTCSCWMPRAFFINWFANVVASWLLATSTPSHRVTFACGVSRCMPVTLSNQFYAQRFRCDWSLIHSSARFHTHTGQLDCESLSPKTQWIPLLPQGKEFLPFPRDPDANAVILNCICRLLWLQGITMLNNNWTMFRFQSWPLAFPKERKEKGPRRLLIELIIS